MRTRLGIPERRKTSGCRSMPGWRLTPEEESLPDADDDFDDTLPSDLWFRSAPRPSRPAHRPG